MTEAGKSLGYLHSVNNAMVGKGMLDEAEVRLYAVGARVMTCSRTEPWILPVTIPLQNESLSTKDALALKGACKERLRMHLNATTAAETEGASGHVIVCRRWFWEKQRDYERFCSIGN